MPRPTSTPRTSRIRPTAAVLITAAALTAAAAVPAAADTAHTARGRTFYLDATNGDDQAAGTSAATAWNSLARLSAVTFKPGDTVELRRGQTFSGSAIIKGGGTTDAPITVTAFGTGNAPTLTNPTGWNMLQLQAPHVDVGGLRFADGVVFDNADGQGIRGPKYQLSGAIAITDAGTDARIHDNEFTQVGLGVKTYGTGTLIEHNNFHDLKIAFRGMDSGSETSYGAVGVSINNSGARVTQNEFVNCRSTDSPYGADGGAVEIEGFDHPKNNISIDHNVSLGSQGFTEVTETTTTDVSLTYNISDDYQQFLAFDTTTHPDKYLVAHNTILRNRGGSRLFAIYYYREAGPTPQDSWLRISSNIIQMKGSSVLRDYKWPHDHNLIQATLGDNPGPGDILAAPQLTDTANGDYRPVPTSPAVDNGGPAAGATDVYGNRASVGLGADIGAVEAPKQRIAGASVVKEGGFEQTTAITSASAPWYSEGAFTYGVDSGLGTAHRGQRNASITSTSQQGQWGDVKQTVAVTPHTLYRLTVWLENSGNITQGWLGAKTTAGVPVNEIQHGAAATYQRYVLTVDSGNESQLVVHSGFYAPAGTAWQRIDDVSLQPVR